MLQSSPLSYFAFRYDNYGANPSNVPGTTITAAGANAKGSWTQVATSGNIAQDVCWIRLRVSDGASSGVARNFLLDLGVDPAGGTSYTEVVGNIVCGSSGPVTAAVGHEFLFPLYIKAGSSVAVRVQSSAALATLRAGIKFYGQKSRPEAMPMASFSETIGTITNSNGVSFTPGNAADGSWTSLGTTAKRMWWWQLGYQIDNTAVTAEYTYIELAYGDGSNKHTILTRMHQGTTSEQIGSPAINGNLNLAEAFCDVPAGSTLYVRGRCNNAPDSGYNAVAIGFGG